ncbi:roadblock/LC7 domain-containing protein [Streptomyces sp. NPDC059785]|uniref:roadblock/LC7 domain-containing protein n=1 Tax=Streptomyces sp. NPDC059785 TaxID=3346945 RepID=UPI0036686D2A
MNALPSANDPVTEVLTAFRDRVLGVSESVISTGDGLLVVADTDSSHPESVAALAAAHLSLGRRMAEQTGTGPLREVVSRGATGHVVILAIGERALLTVIGDEGLDVEALRHEAPLLVERLGTLLEANSAAG